MLLGDFRAIYFPYCLKIQENGSYAVLNRQYKPVGFNTDDFINYEDYPVTSKLSGIGPGVASKLSYEGNPSLESIYLYDDASNPLISKSNMDAYLKKLAILAKLTVKT